MEIFKHREYSPSGGGVAGVLSDGHLVVRFFHVIFTGALLQTRAKFCRVLALVACKHGLQSAEGLLQGQSLKV